MEGVESGKIRSIGVSNYGVHHLEELASWQKEQTASGKSGGLLSVNQVERSETSLVHSERSVAENGVMRAPPAGIRRWPRSAP